MEENFSKERIEQIRIIYSGWFKKIKLKGKSYNESLSILIRASGLYFGIYENWKDVYRYEGLYQVSNFGNVKSLNYNHTGKEKTLRPGIDGRGYCQVSLSKNIIIKPCKSHQLVAFSFAIFLFVILFNKKVYSVGHTKTLLGRKYF